MKLRQHVSVHARVSPDWGSHNPFLVTHRVPAKMRQLLLKSADVLYNAHFWAILHETMCSFLGCEVLYHEVRKETA